MHRKYTLVDKNLFKTIQILDARAKKNKYVAQFKLFEDLNLSLDLNIFKTICNCWETSLIPFHDAYFYGTRNRPLTLSSWALS